MKTNNLRQNTFALIAALIWGTAFVAQSMAAETVSAFAFNAARSYVGGLVLIPVWLLFAKSRKNNPEAANWKKKDLLIGGICCGSALFIAAYLQQKGLETTTAGKAGFITALYIIIVPIFGLFLKKKAPKSVWLGVMLAVVGLYFLCINETVTIAAGDLYIVGCAFCFAGHILTIDHFAPKVDIIAMSCIQFFVTAVLSTVGALLWESQSWVGLEQALFPILYVGVFSSGVAYTLQIFAQRGSNPTVISLLLSMESVFAVLAGAIILGDSLSGREYFGCLLVLLAVVLSQLPEKKEQIVK
ncbi:DMT family transporter [Bengtsoniella intestinalis]|uniref:DMT family transporter n=1 Tax=Bengtsoniella intestinalis TaxID=3073143 RepID=UPI00391F6BBE